MTSRTITVDALARVEGEGALTIVVEGDEVKQVELRIFEPPRFFEALLQGRPWAEAPDVTARICGICPVAYQLSACQAIETAHGVRVGGALRALRRLFMAGEWIESHALHMVMLHAPDFLGVRDVTELAARAPERVRGALRLKKAGNAIMTRVGGREIHPVNVRVGGFHRAPDVAELRGLLPELHAAAGEAEALLDWCAGFDFPRLERDVELVALHHPDEYAMHEGRWRSTGGLDLAIEEVEDHLIEEQAPWSTALRGRLAGRGPYLTGPQARLALNFEQLAPRARAAAERVGTGPRDVRNPFRSILARGVEVIHAVDEAIRLIENYAPPRPAALALPAAPVARRGAAITEAPRGSLYQRYDLEPSGGAIAAARIVPPTAQNQRAIEEDLRQLAATLIALPEDAARARAEHAIRNHDPCISCSTHFLELSIERRG